MNVSSIARKGVAAGIRLLVTLSIVGLSGVGVAAAAYDPGRIQVQLNPGHTIAEVNASYGTVTVDSLPPLFLLQVPSGQDDDALIAQMLADPANPFACVEHSWRNETPEGTRQMVVAAVGGTILEYLDQELVSRLHLPEAHSQSTGEGTVVAVLDTGVRLDHEALAGVVLATGYDFVDNDSDPSDSANGVDDDADGLPDEAAGHGTLVSGIVHLMAPGAAVLPVRVLDDEGCGSTFAVAKGIRYAVEQGADVINLSLGLTEHSGIITHEVALAHLGDVAMVAAAGNLGVDTVQYFPASDARVLMIAALDSVDVKASFSNYHPKVAVSAPGVGIYGPYFDGAYAIGAGTSFATPFIAGECALLRSLEPWLTPDQLYDRVLQSVVDIYSIPENRPYLGKLGTGRLDGLPLLLTSPVHDGSLPAVGSRPGARVVPNPVVSGGLMRLSWPHPVSAGTARLSVHDVAGRMLRRVAAGALPGLSFPARDDAGRPLPSGAYFLRFQDEGTTRTAHFVVVK